MELLIPAKISKALKPNDIITTTILTSRVSAHSPNASLCPTI